MLYRLASSDRLESWVRSWPVLERRAYRAARRYVAGISLGEALQTVEWLHRDGLAASLDLFGEGAASEIDIARTVEAYRDAAAALADSAAGAYLEIVPSHLGLDLGLDTCRRHVNRIVEALPAGVRLEVSAEEAWRTEAIMQLVQALAADGAPVTVTLQSNLRRSAADSDALIDAGIPVRLVKGAYLERPGVAYPWGEPTDLAFVWLAHRFHQAGAQLSLATHDAVIRDALLGAMPGVGIEMLLGVGSVDAYDLASRGHHVRVYVPYGHSWFRYWARRTTEALGT